jgi:hypothetical protein
VRLGPLSWQFFDDPEPLKIRKAGSIIFFSYKDNFWILLLKSNIPDLSVLHTGKAT